VGGSRRLLPTPGSLRLLVVSPSLNFVVFFWGSLWKLFVRKTAGGGVGPETQKGFLLPSFFCFNRSKPPNDMFFRGAENWFLPHHGNSASGRPEQSGGRGLQSAVLKSFSEREKICDARVVCFPPPRFFVRESLSN